MIINHLLLALHLLGAVVWVGGMSFAYWVARPSMHFLAREQRLILHAQAFRRFFRIIWHAMPLMLITGYVMIFTRFGGFAALPWAVTGMQLLGLAMAAVFLVVVFGPWPRMRNAVEAAKWEEAAVSLEAIRKLILLNLSLGLVTVTVAGFAG